MRIKVKVIPRAKKHRIENKEDCLKVYLTEPAIEGRANKRLLEMLADYFGVKKYQIAVTYGEKSKNKVIEINNL